MTRRKWEEWELKELAFEAEQNRECNQLRGSARLKKLAAHLGRSYTSVRKQASRMGLWSNYRKDPSALG